MRKLHKGKMCIRDRSGSLARTRKKSFEWFQKVIEEGI